MVETGREIAFHEISKRVDNVEEDVVRLRDKLHEYRNEYGAIVLNMEEMDNTLTNIYQNQKSISNNIIDLTKRLIEIEKINMQRNVQIQMVTGHWKLILGVISISILIGFAVENGLKDVVKILLPDKVIQVATTVR